MYNHNKAQQSKNHVHISWDILYEHHSARNVDDLHVLYGRLDIWRFSLKLYGAKLWNYFPCLIKFSTSLPLFKQNIKNYLLERKMFTGGLQ